VPEKEKEDEHTANKNEAVKSTPHFHLGLRFRAAGEMPKENVHSSIDASEGNE
jgi:hypothetical protein